MEDNTTKVMTELAQRLLTFAESLPESVVSQYSLNGLKNYLKKDVNDRHTDQLSLELRLNGSSVCTVYLGVESDWTREDNRVEDEHGNVFRACKLRAEVNWSCWGSSLPDVTLEFARLLILSAELAQRVKDEVQGPFLKLIETKAERTLKAFNAQCAKSEERVRHLVRSNCRNMRVGAKRRVENPEGGELGIDFGSYTVNVGQGDGSVRSYSAPVIVPHAFYFTRTA